MNTTLPKDEPQWPYVVSYSILACLLGFAVYRFAYGQLARAQSILAPAMLIALTLVAGAARRSRRFRAFATVIFALVALVLGAVLLL